MPTIETRVAPNGAVTYRAKIRLKGSPSVCASFARKTDATKWGHSTEAAIREGRYFKASAAKRCTLAETIAWTAPTPDACGNSRPRTAS